MSTDPGNIYIIHSQTHECGNWTEAAQFPEKEYINGIFLVLWADNGCKLVTRHGLTFDANL
jgi:hypothetical protein